MNGVVNHLAQNIEFALEMIVVFDPVAFADEDLAVEWFD